MDIREMPVSIKKQAGDTIVEVVISVAIISLVITIAYAMANRSLHQGITANEHTQALKLAESQLESLKFRQQQSSKQDFLQTFAGVGGNSDHNYCLNINATGPADSKWGPVANSPDIDSLQTGPGHYNQNCLDSQYSKYYTNINVINTVVSGTPSTAYHITVRWDAIGGGQDQVQLYYRF